MRSSVDPVDGDATPWLVRRFLVNAAPYTNGITAQHSSALRRHSNPTSTTQ